MRSTGLLIIVILLTLLTGALLAWPVHFAIQPYTDLPYHKIVSRITSLLALVFIFMYLYMEGSLNRTTAGFAGGIRDNLRNIITGLIAGLLIMLVLGAGFLALGIQQWDPELEFSLRQMALILIKAILAGLLVGLVEETIYRGALLGGLLKNLNMWIAVVISSVLYAAVHFVKFRALPEDSVITPLTGIGMLPDAFFRFADPAIADSFISLAVFGVLLALIRLREGNIYRCIGLHAGVVMAIKLINEFMDFVPGNQSTWLVSKYDHILGHMTTLWLCLLIMAYLVYVRVTRPSTKPVMS